MAEVKCRKPNLGSNHSARKQSPRVAPQAAAHRRGGTHRVKDEHKTNTIFDEWDYKQLKSECIERGIYIKDMKKVSMARALADNNLEKKRAERAAIMERETKLIQQAKEKQREADRRLEAEVARQKKRIEKERRRERDEDVSDDTPDEEELQKMHDELLVLERDMTEQGPAGQALSEESWDSTSSESTVHSTAPLIGLGCRLRLFEWPHVAMPSPTASSSSGRAPRNIPYIPIKIHTTESKEKLFLPGQTYPPGVDPDYVPVLSEQTRNAARNGILEGVLRNAAIERASTWTDRTLVQGWNARMYFSLPPRNSTKTLLDVYNKWNLEDRKTLRVKPIGDVERVSRDKRHALRRMNKVKKTAEVLEASEHRLTAVCYLASYLDFDADQAVMRGRQRKEQHTLENLFFIRFPGCDVPHYYFWTRKGEWADPTTPNPNWNSPTQQEEGAQSDESVDQVRRERHHPQLAGKRLPKTAHTIQKTYSRVKKPTITPSSAPPPSTVINTTWQIEHELYVHGISAVLSGYCNKWLADGKQDAWRVFSRALLMLYPSGQLPKTPAVRAEGAVSIAVKLAAIDTADASTLLSPLSGKEPWTRDDNYFWDVVAVDEEVEPYMSGDIESLPRAAPEVLHRRSSMRVPSRINTADCAAWLQQISPSYVPLSASSLPHDLPHEVAEPVRLNCDSVSLQPGMDVTCPSCHVDLHALGFRQQAEHMALHNNTVRLRTPFLRRSSVKFGCVDEAFFDAGADADTESALPCKRRTVRSHRRCALRESGELANTLPTHLFSEKVSRVAGEPRKRRSSSGGFVVNKRKHTKTGA